jgi:vancomycin resistance protein YoaR
MTVANEAVPTTANEFVAATADEDVARGPRLWLRFAAAFIVGLLAMIAVIGVGLAAYGAVYEGRVLPGVRVGDADLSGLDRQQAGTALAEAYTEFGEGRVLIRTDAGDVSVPYREFSRRPDVEAMLDAAFAEGRTGNPLDRALTEVRTALDGRTLAPRVAFDEVALAAAVDRRLARLERAPSDARIATVAGRMVTIAARPGQTFDVAAAQALAVAAVAKVDAPREIVVGIQTIAVQPAVSDAVVGNAEAEAARMIRDLVVTDGSNRWSIRAVAIAQWIEFKSLPDGSITTTIEADRIAPALASIGRAVEEKPVSASYLTAKGGRIFGVVAGHNGQSLDAEASAAAIAQALGDRREGAGPDAVDLTVIPVEPKLTTAEAQQKAPVMTKLGSWKTWFPIGERNYWGANIWLPAQIINGTILQPGQRFEWWSAIGPVSTSRGYGPGGLIMGSRTLPTGSIGGGMCSSSTTLFNAALRAGLKMGARTNHAYYITRYPLGLDATVYRAGGLTMSFTNDMKNPILIRGYRIGGSSGKGWVGYEIWGTSEGREVSISKPAVSNVRQATTRTVYTSSLPTGVRRQTEVPANGMDVAVTRVVRDRNGNVLHRETYHSDYVLWHGLIEIGR